MDFSLSDEQQAIADLSTQLLTDQATPTRIKELENTDELVFDRDLWAKLAEANLLGVAIPEANGGLGFGPVELGLLLEQVGRTVAPVPVLATLAYGAAPIAHFGTDAQRDALLPGVVSGTTVLTAALVEPLGDPLHPTTTATADRTTVVGCSTASRPACRPAWRPTACSSRPPRPRARWACSWSTRQPTVWSASARTR